MAIHWCGTGLSSGPGLRRLLEAGQKVVVWNRTVEKAREVVGDLTGDIRPYSLEALTAALQPGDIAVSMLPADQHVSIAKACLAKGANFVSSSYIAPEMRALDSITRSPASIEPSTLPESRAVSATILPTITLPSPWTIEPQVTSPWILPSICRSTLADRLPVISTSDAITENVCPEPRILLRPCAGDACGPVSGDGLDFENIGICLQELLRVDCGTIDAHFKMQMRTGRTAG